MSRTAGNQTPQKWPEHIPKKTTINGEKWKSERDEEKQKLKK
jgi:hypothetical protein